MKDDNRSSAALTVATAGSSAEAVGTTVITEEVVAQIAGIAARHVNGVAALVGRPRGLQVVGWERLLPAGHSRGVAVRVRDSRVEINVDLIGEYPAPLQRVCDAVRIAVTEAVETFVGLRVVEVNITVVDMTVGPPLRGNGKRSPSRTTPTALSRPPHGDTPSVIWSRFSTFPPLKASALTHWDYSSAPDSGESISTRRFPAWAFCTTTTARSSSRIDSSPTSRSSSD